MDKTPEFNLVVRLLSFTGLTATEVARRAGISASTLTRLTGGGSGNRLRADTMDKLREAFPDFFEQDSDRVVRTISSGYLEIPVLPSFAGMGGGGSGEGDRATALIPRRLVEEKLRASPDDLILIECRGDSMAPEFLHGDQVLCDKRDANPVQPGAFALFDGDGYVLKLVERIAQRRGWYRIFSRNQTYSAYEVEADQVRILGRPVWVGREL